MPTEAVDWEKYLEEQHARREIRCRERLGGLIGVLPQGFAVEILRGDPPSSPTYLKISGYGVELRFNPTHGTLWWGRGAREKQEDVLVWQVVALVEWLAYRDVLARCWSLRLTGGGENDGQEASGGKAEATGCSAETPWGRTIVGMDQAWRPEGSTRPIG